MEKYRPHLCEVCGKRIMQLHHLREHAMIHLPPDQRPYKCEICGRTFTRSHSLKRHRMGHTGLFNCDFCDKMFNKSYDLSYHMTVHHQRKKRPCSVCGRNFVSERALKTHMNKHLPKETCSLCKKTLLRKNMKQHMKMHRDKNEVFCSICHLPVPRDRFKAHFARHMRRPRTEHVCSTCGRKFLRLGDYKSHLITHSEEYLPYICEQCDKSFVREGNYKRHMKLHGDMESQHLKGIEKGRENKIPTESSKLSDLPILSGLSNQCQQNDFGPHTNDSISGPLKSTSGKRQVVRGDEKSMPRMKVGKGHEYKMDSKSSVFSTPSRSNRCLRDDIKDLLKSTTGERHVVHEKNMPPMKDEEEDLNEIASKSEFSKCELPPALPDQLNVCSQKDFSPHTRFLKLTSDKGHVVHRYTETMPTLEVGEEDENEITSNSSESFSSDHQFSQYVYKNYMPVSPNTEMDTDSPSEMEEIVISYQKSL